MKRFMLACVGFIFMLNVLVSAQSTPQYLKVNLKESRFIPNTIISSDNKTIYLFGEKKEILSGEISSELKCSIELWNLENGGIQRSIQLPTCSENITPSPDEKVLIYTNSYGASSQAVDLKTLRTIWEKQSLGSYPIFSPSSKFFSLIYYGNSYNIYDVEGKKIAKIDIKDSNPSACCNREFSKDGNFFIFRSQDRLEIYETKTFNKVKSILLPKSRSRELRLTNDSKFILSFDPKTKYPALWNVETGKIDRIFTGTIKCENDWDDCIIKISPNNKWFIVGTNRFKNSTRSFGSNTEFMSLIDFNSGKPVQKYPHFSDELLFTPNSSKLVYQFLEPSVLSPNGVLTSAKVYMYIWNLPQ